MGKTEIQLVQDRVQHLEDMSFAGRNSPVFISGTSAVTINNGYCIHFKEDTVIAAITYASHASSDTLVGETFLAGFPLYLNNIVSITLTSGACLVYEK